RMFNADGSESEMCGNGLRCVAKYVYDHGIARKPRLAIETGRGILTVELEVKQDKVSRVRVDMGAPILQSSAIPTKLPGDPPVDVMLVVSKFAFHVTCVSMGNPHAVHYILGDKFFQSGEHDPVAKFGPLVENCPAFPR